MFITFKRSKIFYEVLGEGENFVTFLCGWGYGSELLTPFAKQMKNTKMLFIDFPCFGRSENIKEVWTLSDYANLVYAILKNELNQNSTKIVAHSFGGKVAILLEKKYNCVENLVLMASAGVKPKFSLSKLLKILHYKHLKKNGKCTKNCGSVEYRALPNNASKKTFVNVVNTNVEKECQDVKCKTLIIAGQNDKITPMYMQKKLHKFIKNSTLKIFDVGHFVWIKNFEGVKNAITNFWKEDK